MKSKVLPRVFFDVEIGGSVAGRIIFELFSDVCPKTTENFRSLCTGERGMGDTTGKPLHYKGVVFHRVVRDFMIQSGDFSEGNGRGGESIYGGYFPDESFSHKHDRPFLLSMANRGKNTNGSQFFITTQPTPHLDGVHVAFGRVVSGEAVVKKIESQPTDANSRPKKECKIVHCGELILAKTKKVKAKKKKEAMKDSDGEHSGRSSPESSDSEEESKKKKKKKKKRKHKKEKKKEKQQDEKASSAEDHEDVTKEKDPDLGASRGTVTAEEVPPVPEQRFLMRSDERHGSDRTNSTNTPASQRSQGRQWVSRSGRKVKGRGVLRYRTPSRSRSRSRSPRRRSFRSRHGSETPPHWREAQRGQRPLHEVVGGSRDSPESGRWRRRSRTPDNEDEHKHRSIETKSSLSKEKDEGEKENKYKNDRHPRSRRKSRDRDNDNRSRRGSESTKKHDVGRSRRNERSADRQSDRKSRSNEGGSGNITEKDRKGGESRSTSRKRRFRENPGDADMGEVDKNVAEDLEAGDVLESQQNEIEISADDHKDDKTSVLPGYGSDSSVKEESDAEAGGINPPGESDNEQITEDVAVDKTGEKNNLTSGRISVGKTDEQSETGQTAASQGESLNTAKTCNGAKAQDEESKTEDQGKAHNSGNVTENANRKSNSPRKRSRSSSRKRRRSRSSSRKRSRSRNRSKHRSQSPKRRRSRSRSPRRRASYRNRHSRSRSRDRGRRHGARRSRSVDRRSRYDRRRSRSRSSHRRSSNRRDSYRSRRRNSRSRSRSADKRKKSQDRKSRSNSKGKDSRSPRKRRSSDTRRRSNDSSTSQSSDSD